MPIKHFTRKPNPDAVAYRIRVVNPDQVAEFVTCGKKFGPEWENHPAEAFTEHQKLHLLNCEALKVEELLEPPKPDKAADEGKGKGSSKR